MNLRRKHLQDMVMAGLWMSLCCDVNIWEWLEGRELFELYEEYNNNEHGNEMIDKEDEQLKTKAGTYSSLRF